ncbi:MAG: hypothetical protein UHH87_09550, partial [Akkermansia sp.]|nr:hypothetical protein [Akkermansia sp.]
MAALDIKEDEPLVWPTQKEVRSGRSVFGAPGEAALVNVAPPYPLFYEGEQVRSIRVHRIVAPVVLGALQQVLDEYGPERIRALGLDQYGGSYNYRQTTGAGSLSMHAWGIALDFCPAGNGMSAHAPAATLSHPDCRRWWEIWESLGAVSMGRACDYDWMHLQFARL